MGALAGVWSALLGYLSIYGVRRHPESSPSSPSPGSPATELELARSREVETTRDAAERRVRERLHALVQSELGRISETLNSELHALQDQVAELRGELVEKVGGQLRLERVETTRVIGSNIEAFEHEEFRRRLAVGRDDVGVLSRGQSTSMNAIDATTEIPVVDAPVIQSPVSSRRRQPPVVAPIVRPVPPVAVPPPVRPPVGPPVVVAAAAAASPASVTAPARPPARRAGPGNCRHRVIRLRSVCRSAAPEPVHRRG